MAPGDAVWKQNLAPAEVFTTRQRAHGSPACSVGVEFFFPFLFSLTCAKISLGSVPIRPWRTKKKAPSLKTTHHPQQGEKLKREGEGGLPGSGQLGSRSFTARASGNSPGSWLPGAEGCARLQVLLSHGTSVNLPSHTLHPFPVPFGKQRGRIRPVIPFSEEPPIGVPRLEAAEGRARFSCTRGQGGTQGAFLRPLLGSGGLLLRESAGFKQDQEGLGHH